MFSCLENWNYFDSLYFCFITFTTIGKLKFKTKIPYDYCIGYGDKTLQEFSSVVALIAYVLIGLVTLAYVISIFTEVWSHSIEKHALKTELKRTENQHFEEIFNTQEKMKFLNLKQEITINNTNNDKDELIPSLLEVAKLYQHHMTNFIHSNIDNCDIDNPKNHLNLQRLKLYENLYKKLVELCDLKFNQEIQKNLIPNKNRVL